MAGLAACRHAKTRVMARMSRQIHTWRRRAVLYEKKTRMMDAELLVEKERGRASYVKGRQGRVSRAINLEGIK